MIIILELLSIILYMIDYRLGFLYTSIYFFVVGKSNKKNIINMLVILNILSLPFFSISIFGDKLHHLLSWTNINLCLLSLYMLINLIKNKSKKLFLPVLYLISILLILVIRSVFNSYLFDNLKEILQILLMLVPILIIYCQKNNISDSVDEEHIDKWNNYIRHVIIATSIAVIIQGVLYIVFKIEIGNVSAVKDRVIFDLFFKGFSVLSIFLGLGLGLFLNDFFKKPRISLLLTMFLIFVAILINTSRAGLFAAFFVCVLVLIYNLYKKKLKLRYYIFIFIGAVLLGILGLVAISKMRGGIGTLFDDSGRLGTYKYGISLFTSSVGNTFFGNGLSSLNYTGVFPHNFIIQTLMQMGLIVCILFLYGLKKLLCSIKNFDYLIVILTIIIGCMFITDFYANTFFTVYSIIGIMASKKIATKKVNIVLEKEDDIDNTISGDIKISIILPIYNVRRNLKKCIASLIKQSYKNIEIILIDNGSKDESSLVCDKLYSFDYRIKVIHKEHENLSKTLNKGLDIATGDYLMFCDVSIEYEADFVYNYVKLCNGNDIFEIIIGYVQTFMDSSKILFEKKLSPKTQKLNRNYLIKRYQRISEIGDINCILNKLYNNKIIKSNRIRFNQNYENYVNELFNVTYLSTMRESDRIIFSDSFSIDIINNTNYFFKKYDIKYFRSMNKIDKEINSILVDSGIYIKNRQYIEEQRIKKVYNALCFSAKTSNYDKFKSILKTLDLKKFNEKHSYDIKQSNNKYLKKVYFMTNLDNRYIIYKYFRLLKFKNFLKYFIS